MTASTEGENFHELKMNLSKNRENKTATNRIPLRTIECEGIAKNPNLMCKIEKSEKRGLSGAQARQHSELDRTITSDS